MKHCPKCKDDYADKFDLCFKCGDELSEGSLPDSAAASAVASNPDLAKKEIKKKEEIKKEDIAASSRMIDLAKRVAVVAVGLLVSLAIISVVMDKSIPLLKKGRFLVSERYGHNLVEEPGKITTKVAHGEFNQAHNLEIPSFDEKTEMLVYYPVDTTTVFLSFLPEFKNAAWHEDSIVVTVGLSDQRTSSMARIMEGMTQTLAKRHGRSASGKQILLVARIPRSDAKVCFAVPKKIGGTDGEIDMAKAGQDFAREITIGSGSHMLWNIVIYGGITCLFYLALLKFM